jgi:dihydropteroate synthase
MQGTPETMQVVPLYEEVVAEVEGFLAVRVEAALQVGVKVFQGQKKCPLWLGDSH